MRLLLYLKKRQAPGVGRRWLGEQEHAETFASKRPATPYSVTFEEKYNPKNGRLAG